MGKTDKAAQRNDRSDEWISHDKWVLSPPQTQVGVGPEQALCTQREWLCPAPRLLLPLLLCPTDGSLVSVPAVCFALCCKQINCAMPGKRTPRILPLGHLLTSCMLDLRNGTKQRDEAWHPLVGFRASASKLQPHPLVLSQGLESEARAGVQPLIPPQ